MRHESGHSYRENAGEHCGRSGAASASGATALTPVPHPTAESEPCFRYAATGVTRNEDMCLYNAGYPGHMLRPLALFPSDRHCEPGAAEADSEDYSMALITPRHLMC